MSAVPWTTQVKTVIQSTQCSQDAMKIVLIYTENLTQIQDSLMTECSECLRKNTDVVTIQAIEIEKLSPNSKYFVIVESNEDLIKKIRRHFEKPVIYLPRAIIEARGLKQVVLPVRSLAISLTMFRCNVFLVKSCNLPDIRKRINEMSGSLAPNFYDTEPTVVVTDQADDKYCLKAHKKNIPVVSRNWVDDNYTMAMQEDSAFFGQSASETIEMHLVKPFYGLYFKIMVKNCPIKIKELILENEGTIVYGDDNRLTHIVDSTDIVDDIYSTSNLKSVKKEAGPKIVNIDYLETCGRLGYYITKKEYLELRRSNKPKNEQTCFIVDVSIKQERLSPDPSEENLTPQRQHIYPQPPARLKGSLLSVEPSPQLSTSMTKTPAIATPPSSTETGVLGAPRTSRRQPLDVNDMILKALSSCEPPQSQMASTQIRRLPESKLLIEDVFEPSQQLFWNDNSSRRG